MKLFRRKFRKKAALILLTVAAFTGGGKALLDPKADVTGKMLKPITDVKKLFTAKARKKSDQTFKKKFEKSDKKKAKEIAVSKKNKKKLENLKKEKTSVKISLKNIPDYKGVPYVKINGNIPEFSKKDRKRGEEYSELDEYGRCGVAFAKVGTEIMPTEKRGSIGQVRPSGWHTVKYPDIIKDRYLYNRCHLIGYQLAGENANEKNLITGTRYLNVEGMLPFENEVTDYVNRTGNHVLYRVKPIFKKDELVARGVQMEALSVEDKGREVKFNVYCYNVQPGIKINYKDGSSQPEN